MALLITWLPLFYPIGAVAFWVFYRSGSLKRDLWLGLAWPGAVPVIASLSITKRIRAALEQRRTWRIEEQAKHESELLAQEQRFLGYASEGTAQWMTDEVSKEQINSQKTSWHDRRSCRIQVSLCAETKCAKTEEGHSMMSRNYIEHTTKRQLRAVRFVVSVGSRRITH